MAVAEYHLVGHEHADHASALVAAMRRLATNRARMPAALYELMTAAWHYDPSDRRALHDMRVRSILVRESATPEPTISIELTLLGAYYDRELRMTYGDVRRYELGLPACAEQLPPAGSHGDVLEDEVVVLDNGNVVHAIELSRGPILEIAFRGGFSWTWADVTS